MNNMSLSCDGTKPIRNTSVAGSTLQQLTNEVQHSNIISLPSPPNTTDSEITRIAYFGMFSSSPTSSNSSSSTCESGVVLKSNSINSSLNGSPVSSKSSISVITTLSPTSSIHNLITDLSNSRCHSVKKQVPEIHQETNCISTIGKSMDMDICQTNDSCNDMSLVNLSTVSNMSLNNAFGYINTDVKTRNNAQLLLNGLNGENNLNNNQQSTVPNSLSEDPRTLQLALNLSMLGINESNVVFTNLAQQQLQAQTLEKKENACSQQSTKLNLNTLNGLNIAISSSSNTSNVQNYCNNAVQNSFSTKSNNSSALLLPPLEERSKKSQNMTECVPVPSSEHVAEIVGRQGCKIKALRAKTNTYIKTPVRGEEPVFVVTGRKEDVAKAKREILSAADHFSLIRATRKPSIEGSISSGGNDGNSSNGRTPPCPQSIPGQVTIQVRVPYRVVGLVVGPKGATIKHIQQETHTYIVTPSREKEPIFEVTGLPENVESARHQIEAHIAMRTGSLQNNYIANGITGTDEASSMHTMNTLSQILNEEINQDFLTTICKNGISSAFDFIETNNGTNNGCPSSVGFSSNADLGMGSITLNNSSNGRGTSSHTALLSSSSINCNNLRMQTNFNHNQNSDYLKTLISSVGNSNDYECNIENNLPSFLHTNSISKLNDLGNQCVGSNNLNLIKTGVGIMLNTNGMTRSCSSASSTTSSKSANKSGDSRNSASAKSNSSRPELVNIWQNLGDSCEVDEGIGDSPSIWTLPKTMVGLTGSHCSPTASISPTDSLLGDVINSTTPYGRSGFNIMSSTSLKGTQATGMIIHNNENDSESLLQQQLMQQQINGIRRDCLVCNDKEVTAALVPCGHNMFCMDCANRICTSLDSSCPVCSVTVYHAMRILA